MVLPRTSASEKLSTTIRDPLSSKTLLLVSQNVQVIVIVLVGNFQLVHVAVTASGFDNDAQRRLWIVVTFRHCLDLRNCALGEVYQGRITLQDRLVFGVLWLGHEGRDGARP